VLPADMKVHPVKVTFPPNPQLKVLVVLEPELASRLVPRRFVTSPRPFQRLRQCLFAHPAIAMAGVEGEHVLILIALILERRGHTVIGNDPIVHVVAHDVWIEEIAIAHLHPYSNGLGCCAPNERRVIIPRAPRIAGIERPLLVDERA
jgi:hypothetical protein